MTKQAVREQELQDCTSNAGKYTAGKYTRRRGRRKGSATTRTSSPSVSPSRLLGRRSSRTALLTLVSIPVVSIPLVSIPLVSIPLVSIPLVSIPLVSIPMSMD